MKMNNKTYDVLKWIAQFLLPAAGTLYFALAGIWSLPYGEQVVGTITAVDTFLGVLLESVPQTITRTPSNVVNAICTAILIYDSLPIYVWAAFYYCRGYILLPMLSLLIQQQRGITVTTAGRLYGCK